MVEHTTIALIAAIIIIIAVAIAVLVTFGVRFNIFDIFTGKGMLQQKLCKELATKGCINVYMPNLEEERSNILYSEIGQRPIGGENRAKFREVCEYLGFDNFDECLKNCHCLVP